MGLHWIWWIAAALTIGAELLTGTYYLLAVGAALAGGGIAAWAGLALELQLLCAGVLGVVFTSAAHRLRLRRAQPPLQPGLDIGNPVTVQAWNADGSLRVAYRGSQWDAVLAGPEVVRAETLYIVATRGSVLVLANRRAA